MCKNSMWKTAVLGEGGENYLVHIKHKDTESALRKADQLNPPIYTRIQKVGLQISFIKTTPYFYLYSNEQSDWGAIQSE